MTRLAPDARVVRAARRPHEPALRTATIRWTRSQLLEATDGCAAALAAEGVGSGSRVAALLADDAPAIVLLGALRRLGAVLVPLNRRAAGAELRAQLRSVRAGWLIRDDAHTGTASEVAGEAVASLRIEPLLAGAPCAPRGALSEVLDLDAPAVIVFTSGTGGSPRGVVLTHGNLAASAHAWAAVLGPRRTDHWLACLPLFHVAGLALVTRAERWGAQLSVHPRFDAGAVSRALDAGVSHCSLVAVQLEALLLERAQRPAPASLRAILLGGGPIPADLLARARGLGYPVLTTYGMTETASGVVVGGADEATRRAPDTGRALPGVELRIASDGSGEGSGEILVRGPMVFAGYADAHGTSTTRIRDGWLHTGDTGSLGADGLLRVHDRRDDLIISGGENIAPAEVERVLAAHPAVAEAAVVAWPHERWGAVPAAAVVLRPGARVTDAELARHCRRKLARYKVPARIVVMDSLPRTALGKVSRHLVRQALLEASG